MKSESLYDLEQVKSQSSYNLQQVKSESSSNLEKMKSESSSRLEKMDVRIEDLKEEIIAAALNPKRIFRLIAEYGDEEIYDIYFDE